MAAISQIIAREILDSRGNPTVEVDIALETGHTGRASVPSGASTGKFEAVEKRDGDKKRYGGKGVLGVVESINTEIFEKIRGLDAREQRLIDYVLRDTDGTDNKGRLGANALLAVSLAAARAGASLTGMPLYRYLGGVHACNMPMPMMNILNGGKHGDNPLDIQEFMIIPARADSFSEGLRMGTEVFHKLKETLKKEGLNTNVGDEGGFSPNVPSTEKALELILKSVEGAGYEPGEDIEIALDVAATECYKGDQYSLDGKKYKGPELVAYYESLTEKYPITSIEDGFAEEDWENWSLLTQTIGGQVQIVGDDLFVTNPTRLEQGILSAAANAILIKPNQIGTLSETLETIFLAQKVGYRTVISHRSGETEDTFIADLAVATNAGQIKTGSLSRTDRVAKYNQLLRIEEDLGPGALFG